jgi:hypothetical protein
MARNRRPRAGHRPGNALSRPSMKPVLSRADRRQVQPSIQDSAGWLMASSAVGRASRSYSTYTMTPILLDRVNGPSMKPVLSRADRRQVQPSIQDSAGWLMASSAVGRASRSYSTYTMTPILLDRVNGPRGGDGLSSCLSGRTSSSGLLQMRLQDRVLPRLSLRCRAGRLNKLC